MRHAEAWRLLPDLLDDRDRPDLLAHVHDCARCQRQLFLLGRVDRLLRGEAARRGSPRRRRLVVTAAGAAAAAAVAAAVLVQLPGPPPHGYTLRTAAGRPVGEAVLGRSEAHNVSLALIAHGLPRSPRGMFALWAGDGSASIEVGPFMVDARGGCRVRFNLPATHVWTRFWIVRPENATAVVAAT